MIVGHDLGLVIDMNADVGEGMATDDDLLRLVTSARIPPSCKLASDLAKK